MCCLREPTGTGVVLRTVQILVYVAVLVLMVIAAYGQLSSPGSMLKDPRRVQFAGGLVAEVVQLHPESFDGGTTVSPPR
jgi:hypothetical protein